GLTAAYPRQAARLHLSCDVDHPQLWNRPTDRLRTLAGSLFRRFDPAELAFWLGGPVWRQADPFDTFESWMDLAASRNLRLHFNFLAGRAAYPDCDYDLNTVFVRKLMSRIHERGHEIGFHPSRAAAADARQFQQELEALRAAAPAPIRSGRQHYLHFSVPETWRFWAAAGMDWESSLGYAEQEGFRCGIAQSFPAFDCERQAPLPIRELPLIAMDVTLAQYRRLSPDQAVASLEQLGGAVRKHGGDMVLLWHNSSWNTHFWRPWQDVLLHTIQKW
ncbi:MAG: polysaccharide deacetylase family protein, partial [Saprospiraceae bacterium]